MRREKMGRAQWWAAVGHSNIGPPPSYIYIFIFIRGAAAAAAASQTQRSRLKDTARRSMAGRVNIHINGETIGLPNFHIPLLYSSFTVAFVLFSPSNKKYIYIYFWRLFRSAISVPMGV